jgi:hypothetical protein
MEKTVAVPPLEPGERRGIIEKFLKDAGKDPAALPVDKLATAPQSANALYLRVVLNELKMRASFGKVDALLDDLLLAKDPSELFVRVLKNQGGHTEAMKSRYELLLIPAKMVLSGRRKIVKLAVGSKFASFLKQAYQRHEEWLGETAPQLSLSMGKAPPWLLFDPTQTTSSAVT